MLPYGPSYPALFYFHDYYTHKYFEKKIQFSIILFLCLDFIEILKSKDIQLGPSILFNGHLYKWVIRWSGIWPTKMSPIRLPVRIQNISQHTKLKATWRNHVPTSVTFCWLLSSPPQQNPTLNNHKNQQACFSPVYLAHHQPSHHRAIIFSPIFARCHPIAHHHPKATSIVSLI